MRGRLFLGLFFISQISIFCYGQNQEEQIFRLLEEKRWYQAVELSNDLFEYVNQHVSEQESNSDDDWDAFNDEPDPLGNFVVIFALFEAYQNSAITYDYLCNKLDKLIGKPIRTLGVVFSNKPENVSYSFYSNENKAFFIHIFDLDNKESILFTFPSSRRNSYDEFATTTAYGGTISDYTIIRDTKNSEILKISLNKINPQ
jgi:hypothetical protein